MANEKRYVIVKTYDLEEWTMPDGNNDPRARLNVGAMRQIAEADVVLAVDPAGRAVVVFDSDIANEEFGPRNKAVVTTIDALPRNHA